MRQSQASVYRMKPDSYLVDKHGKPQAVILSIIDYRNMMRHLEDLEDEGTLKRAVRTSRRTISHDDLVSQLKSHKLL